ncbi:hypothetical protein BDV95DRAFT_680809 [Massariosphaeria phaeospora]|uniref:Uncharacterized protein n=1 Tax=Massariosphaeria phaeospora TaxID=100035 RepID=A0A7C8HY76_9PLEO|nr:hypothetical protein BDV95DRAFT_680809 [Massariosphaeria phaeospora]
MHLFLGLGWDINTPMGPGEPSTLSIPICQCDWEMGANPHCGQLLHWAVIKDKVDALQVVRRIVELGFGLGTLLHRAAEFGKVDIVKYLLEAGADPLKLDTKGQTPRHWAETSNFTELALILKEAEERQLRGTNTQS